MEAFDVSRETMEALCALVDLVVEWNRTVNLISRSSVTDIWSRHIVDSLQLSSCVGAGARTWLDMGSGGGFPGLVIAIMKAGTPTKVRLGESDIRKTAFLSHVIRQLGLDGVVHPMRVEKLDPAAADVISARAFAPLTDLLTFSMRHRGPKTVCLFPKGESAEKELTAAAEHWHMDVERLPSITNTAATILKINHFEPIART